MEEKSKEFHYPLVFCRLQKSINSSGQNLYMGGINVSNHFNKIWEKGTWIKHLICYSFVLLIVFSFVFLSSYHKFVDYINFPTSENCTISMVTYHSGTKDEEGQKYLSKIQSEQVLNFLTSFKFKGFVPGINLSSSEIMYQLTIEAEVPSYTAVFYLPKTMDKLFILDYPLIVATRGK